MDNLHPQTGWNYRLLSVFLVFAGQKPNPCGVSIRITNFYIQRTVNPFPKKSHLLTGIGPLKSQVFHRKVGWPLDNRLAHQKAWSGSNRSNAHHWEHSIGNERERSSSCCVATSSHKTQISMISGLSFGMFPDATLERASQFARIYIFTCKHIYLNTKTCTQKNRHTNLHTYIHAYIFIYTYLHII